MLNCTQYQEEYYEVIMFLKVVLISQVQVKLFIFLFLFNGIVM
jgi:hypothetical protein